MANSNFCTECGQRLDAGVKFCPNCGNAISTEAATKEPPSNVYTPDYQPNDIPNNTPNYAPNYQQNYQPNYQPNYPPNYAPNYQPNYAPNYAPNYTPYYTPGFSTRINDPQIKSALKKNRTKMSTPNHHAAQKFFTDAPPPFGFSDAAGGILRSPC